MFFEPWHMITSFFQYLFLLPAFVNILMVYAFCNTHDVSWGTKGDNTLSAGNEHVKSKKNEQGIEIAKVDVPTDQSDINTNYERLIQQLKVRPEHTKQKRDVKTKREDSNKQFRTRLVLVWIASNAVLISVMTSQWFNNISLKIRPDPATEFNIYLKQ